MLSAQEVPREQGVESRDWGLHLKCCNWHSNAQTVKIVTMFRV